MEKVSLPIKTKVAAWLVILLPIINSGNYLFKLYPLHKELKEYGEFGVSPLSMMVFPLISSIFIALLIGIFLFKRKKLAWNFIVAAFSIFSIGALLMLPILIFQEGFGSIDKVNFSLFLLMLIALILLILDRKNFWKIAT